MVKDLGATKAHPPAAEAVQPLPALTPAQATSRRYQPDEGDAGYLLGAGLREELSLDVVVHVATA